MSEVRDNPPDIKDAIMAANQTPISDAVLALLSYTVSLEQRIRALENKKPWIDTDARSPYDLSRRDR